MKRCFSSAHRFTSCNWRIWQLSERPALIVRAPSSRWSTTVSSSGWVINNGLLFRGGWPATVLVSGGLVVSNGIIFRVSDQQRSYLPGWEVHNGTTFRVGWSTTVLLSRRVLYNGLIERSTTVLLSRWVNKVLSLFLFQETKSNIARYCHALDAGSGPTEWTRLEWPSEGDGRIKRHRRRREKRLLIINFWQKTTFCVLLKPQTRSLAIPLLPLYVCKNNPMPLLTPRSVAQKRFEGDTARRGWLKRRKCNK